MMYMFASCISLVELDMSSWNTENANTLNLMFYNCNKLEKVYVSEYDEENHIGWTTVNVNSSNFMFSKCNKIIGGNGTKYNSNYTDSNYARIDTEETPGYLTNIKDKITEVE